MEDRGIDEIYLDLSELPGARECTAQDAHAGVRAIARRLQDTVRLATGLHPKFLSSIRRLRRLTQIFKALPDGSLSPIRLDDNPGLPVV